MLSTECSVLSAEKSVGRDSFLPNPEPLIAHCSLLRRGVGMNLLDIRDDVRAALDAGEPVVALESTIIAHGFPYPDNLRLAERVEEVVRAAGAVPATIGLVNGRIVVGVDAAQIER